MGNILFLKKGLVHAAPSPWPKNFTDATWEQIIAACQHGNVPDSWKVADSKPMTIDGNDYQIDIIGKNHDVYADGSGTAPLTLQLHDLFGRDKNFYRFMNVSATKISWSTSYARTTQLPAILETMPDVVKTNIREVAKKSNRTNTTTLEETADKLFSLSEVELRGVSQYGPATDEVQYEYYKAGNAHDRVWWDGVASYWQLRTVVKNNASRYTVGSLQANGGFGSLTATSYVAFSFAFCF